MSPILFLITVFRGFNNNKPATVNNSLTTSLEEHEFMLAPGGR